MATDAVDPNDPYEKIRIDQNRGGQDENDIICDVCLDGDAEDKDKIVICELCFAATHQSCYAGSILNQVPKGKWFCDRCLVLVSNPERKCTEIKCKFCPDIDGLMK